MDPIPILYIYKYLDKKKCIQCAKWRYGSYTLSYVRLEKGCTGESHTLVFVPFPGSQFDFSSKFHKYKAERSKGRVTVIVRHQD